MEKDIIGSNSSGFLCHPTAEHRQGLRWFMLQQTGSTSREGTKQTISQHAGCDF
jgi:hypothetical protein